MPGEFLEHLQVVATSPLALIGYLFVVGGWNFITDRRRRLDKLKDLPEADRIRAIERDYKGNLSRGLSPEQWIRAEKNKYIFLGYLATILVVLLIIVVTFRRETTAVAEPPIPTPAAMIPDVVLLPKNDAISQLDTAGLAAAVICQESPSVEATGVVYATTPPAFKRVDPGTEVKLYVSPTCE